MLHIFHKWEPVSTKLMSRLDSTHYTLILYKCTNPKCTEMEIEEVEGHWAIEELKD